MIRTALLVATCIAFAVPAAAQIYKWTDPSGKTHYGDSPPDDAKKQELKIKIPSYDGPVQVRDWAAVIRTKSPQAAPPPDRVTMYSTDWCPHCKNAKKYFESKGIRYTEYNVETSETGRKEYEALGGGGVPVIVVGSKVMRGFSPQSFENLRKAQ
jgi:glutaredoxin-like YruB-family protein